MTTLEIKLYSFEELSEDAKKLALSNYNPPMDHVWDDAYESVKKFNELFKLKEGHRSWLEYINNYRGSINELKGLRLRKFILNNFGWALYRPRYIRVLDKKDARIDHRRVRVKELKNGKILNSYVSGVNIDDTNCVLTGVYSDNNLLKPIYDFIEYKHPKTMDWVTLNDLFDDCFSNLSKAIDNELDYLSSEEYKTEELENEGTVFLENGSKF